MNRMNRLVSYIEGNRPLKYEEQEIRSCSFFHVMDYDDNARNESVKFIFCKN